MKRSTSQRDRDRDTIRRTGAGCGICGQPIDYTLPHLDPMAYVVDHVVPLARGGRDELGNKQAAHRGCNRAKGDLLPPDASRRVLLICGPPGAGKTTLAHTTGLEVYDLDDDRWQGSDSLFRAGMTTLKHKRDATAAVIRTGATLSARRKAAAMCGASEVVVVETDLTTCIERIKRRGRTDPPLSYQINGARKWWRDYEPGVTVVQQAQGRLRRSGSLA